MLVGMGEVDKDDRRGMAEAEVQQERKGGSWESEEQWK